MENEETKQRQKRNIQERSFEFARRIVKLYQHLEKSGATGRTLGKQVLRSGTSIGANLEETEAGQSRADFIAKSSIALKEARETYYWLRLLVACELVSSEQIRLLVAEANELVAILTAIVRKARSQKVAK
ncbi:MAG: four helix bundle protein [Candidatus Binatia bacterium]